MRVFPKHPRRLLYLLLAGVVLVGGRYYTLKNHWCLSHSRMDDQANLLPRSEACYLDGVLAGMERESAVDLRFLFVQDLGGRSFEEYTLAQARKRGLGRDTGRRGLLLVYDVSGKQMRIEVGPKLEGMFTDAFIGYLIRENLRSFFGSGNASFGLRSTFTILEHRIREGVLGKEFDPRVEEHVADARRLAVGGGATAAIPGIYDSSAFLNRTANAAAKAYFAPQPTVAEAYQRYVEWLAIGAILVDVPLFSPESQEWLRDLPITQGFGDFLAAVEFNKAFAIEERGSIALQYFTDDPFVPPHLYRRTRAGWQMDLVGEILNFPNLIGFPYSWYWANTNDEYNLGFADMIGMEGRVPRIIGGDNRPVPVHSRTWAEAVNELRRPWTNLPIHSPPRFESLTTFEAAARIQRARGQSALVVVYQSTDDFQQGLFPDLVRLGKKLENSEVQFLIFCADPLRYKQLTLWLFERSQPTFDVSYIAPWKQGDLVRALQPLGLLEDNPNGWAPPLVAVIDRQGRVQEVAEGVVDLAPFEAALERLAKGAP